MMMAALTLAALTLLSGCRRPAAQQSAAPGRDANPAVQVALASLKFQPVSARPLYATLCVSQDGSRVMRVVLDESKGTGMGYDRLYADTDLDGALSATERLDSQDAQSSAEFAYAGFPQIELAQPFAPGGGDAEQPDLLVLACVRPGPQEAEQLYVTLVFRIAPEGGESWAYGLDGTLAPAPSPGRAPTWDCSGKPKLRIETQPGEPGTLGVAVVASVGKAGLTCEQAMVELAVRSAADESIAHDLVSLSDLGFG